MALPTAAIDRLFDRLAMSYGTEFTNKWGTLGSAEVKSHWAHELGIFVDNLQAIGWALKNLPDRCPNLIEFKSLCRQAPRPDMKALPPPRANPEIVDKELAKIVQKLAKPQTDNVDHKRWAKKLQQRHENGENLSMFQIKCYRDALELDAQMMNKGRE
jgi:hypothetical protein